MLHALARCCGEFFGVTVRLVNSSAQLADVTALHEQLGRLLITTSTAASLLDIATVGSEVVDA